MAAKVLALGKRAQTFSVRHEGKTRKDLARKPAQPSEEERTIHTKLLTTKTRAPSPGAYVHKIGQKRHIITRHGAPLFTELFVQHTKRSSRAAPPWLAEAKHGGQDARTAGTWGPNNTEKRSNLLAKRRIGTAERKHERLGWTGL